MLYTKLQRVRTELPIKHFQIFDIKSILFYIVIGNNDVLVSMPTGSGKSLCYQLPALLHKNKFAIVFSPLLALIKVKIDEI